MADRVIETDVLVVGGGGAGFRAAIGAREKDAECLLLSKGPLGRCGATPMAGADFTLDGKSLQKFGFAGDPRDTKEKFFSDIVHQGFFLNNQKLVEHYVEDAPDRLQELLDWGMKVLLSEERAIVTSGTGIMDALVKKARTVGVNCLDDAMAIDLLLRDGKVMGVLGLDVRTGDLLEFRAKAVVIASGGWHKAFWPNTGMRDLSGEGMAMSYRAGALLGNMEFITFISHTLLSPPVWRGSIIVYVLSMVAGGDLYNSERELFLNRYDSYTVEKGTTMEWNKCFVSHAITREVRAGKGSPHGGIYFRRGEIPWDVFEKKAFMVFPGWKWKGGDFGGLGVMLRNDEPVEIGPAVEYFDGGVVVNEDFETSLPGLYAAGESALGLFGANRIASAITEMLVQGATAGWSAAEYANKAKRIGPDQDSVKALREKILRPLSKRGTLRPAELRRRIQTAAHQFLGPIRKKEELENLLDMLRTAKKELSDVGVSTPTRVYNKEWLDCLELENIITLLDLSARSALVRTESRGVHFREDFPQIDHDHWLLESVVAESKEGPQVRHRPPTVTSLTPPKGLSPYLESMKEMMKAHSEVGGHH